MGSESAIAHLLKVLVRENFSRYNNCALAKTQNQELENLQNHAFE
jgi:hypothetical protein